MKKAGFAIAAALGAGLSFNAAAAGEAAPQITPERMASIKACTAKLDALIESHDTRTPGDNIEHYYFYNDANMVAIKTAVQTGQYETDLARLSLLGQLQTLSAINLVTNQSFHCALLADENGDMAGTLAGREVLDSYVEMTEQLVRYSRDLMDTVKKLKTEGDRLIAAGAKPADRDAPVFLFR